MTRRLIALAATLLMSAPALAQTAVPAPADTAPATETPSAAVTGSYVFDVEHSQIVFRYDHAGLSTSYGVINGVTGTMTLDEAAPEKSSVEASFPLSAIAPIAPGLTSALNSKEFFDGAAPDTRVTFKSTEVKPEGKDAATMTGDLTLNGVTRPVTLEVKFNGTGEHMMTGKPLVGFHAEGTFKRSEFGLGAFAPAVGDEIGVDINVEGIKG